MQDSDTPRRRAHADWPADAPPLALQVDGADGYRLSVQVTYETPTRRPQLVIHKGVTRVALDAAALRRMAQLITDHERLDRRHRP